MKKIITCAVWCLLFVAVVNGAEKKPTSVRSLDQLNQEVRRIRDNNYQQRTVWTEVLVRGNRIDHGPSDQIKIDMDKIEKK
jgi:hypothetical protein